MPKQTTTYRLGYFVNGEITSQITDDRRMRTLDSQLRGLYEVLGNGVLSGWKVGSGTSDLSVTVSSGKGVIGSETSDLSVTVSSGKGVIGFVVVETTGSETVSPLFPNATNYIYATRLPESYWTKTAAFSVSPSETVSDDNILLSVVTTNDTGIVSIDSSLRNNVGLVASIENIVKNHRHTGGTDNPDPVDLESQVEGTLSQLNIPDLDASKVKTGKLTRSVIPKIDHITGLRNQGELTHPQIDSFIQNLSAFGKTVMGETALVNLLQLTLALKHQWPEIDEYLVNHLAFIPGISDNSLIDFTNTTAEVDERPQSEGGLHKIYGSTGPGMRVFTKTWDTSPEFEEAEKDGTTADGDTLRLEAGDTLVTIDDFDTLGNWETKIEDLSSASSSMELDSVSKVSGNYSAKVGIKTLETSNIAFTMRKVFASQDWSAYNGIVFYLNTSDVRHGDLFFYINDTQYGVQKSYTLVIGRNEPTINHDTLLNGWREIYVDLTPYNRASVNSIGFFTSTQYGWDAKSPFELNIDKISLSAGNRFAVSGVGRFIYGNGFPQDFWRVRWDSTLPYGSSFMVRTRVSNSIDDFDQESPTPATWSAYSSTNGFVLPTYESNLYDYAQVEVSMTPTSDRLSSPVLMRLYLDRKASADDTGFTYDEQDQWESGTRFNVDTASSPGSIQIASLTDVDNVFYGSEGSVHQSDVNLSDLYSDSGSSLPKSTQQILNGESAGLGQVSAVKRGENDTIWVADTDNDRVLQLDKAGNIVFGLWGSFLTEPFDGYGVEETGPGSNTDYETLSAVTEAANTDYETLSAVTEAAKVPEALYALYNPSTRILSVVFSANLETVEDSGTTFDRNKMFLRVGVKRVYFGSETQFSLFGVEPDKYVGWAMSANPFIGQFTFRSHILQAVLSQADSVALTSAASLIVPSIVISGTDEQAIVEADEATLTFVTPNAQIGSESEDNNGIRIRTNGGAYSYNRSRSILLQSPDVIEGRNEIEATLVDANNNPFDGEESACSIAIILDSDGSLSEEPRISISSPRQGQTISSTTISVEFEASNHPILQIGSCVEYSLDEGAWTEHRETSPIELVGLSGGRHSISIRLVSLPGIVVSSDLSVATVSFNCGVSAEALVTLAIGAGTIRGVTRSITTKTPEKVVTVHVENLYVSNLFCPVDLQVIPDETSVITPSGNPTIVVAKLRSPSTTAYLAAPPDTTAPVDEAAIFDGSYMDGHSVVQYSMEGQVLMSNNAAQFADTRAHAKIYLGSANKASPSDMVIADAIRNRAIVVRTDLSTGKPLIIWEFQSDRLVSDFQIATSGRKTISVGNSSCDTPLIYVRSGETVVWKNNSNIPISIVSGTTTPTLFASDPDLTLYGDEFESDEIAPGAEYARVFDEEGDLGWFSYPNLVTGIVGVSPSGVSQSDEFLIVEKDPIPSIGSGRVSMISSYGIILWTFGSGVLYDPRDVRRLDGNSIIVST